MSDVMVQRIGDNGDCLVYTFERGRACSRVRGHEDGLVRHGLCREVVFEVIVGYVADAIDDR